MKDDITNNVRFPFSHHNNWWARCKGIRWMGPYENQETAWAAVITAEGVPASEATVWFGPRPK